MNPVALYLASGESLYPGIGLMLLVIAATPWMSRAPSHWLGRTRMLAIWLSLALIIMACPPLPWAVDGVVASLFVAWMGVNAVSNTPRLRGWRIACACLFAASLLMIVVGEVPHRVLPVIGGARADHLVVIGDSISAGIGGDDSRWPVLLQHVSGVPVKNLSQPGAQMADALGWLNKLEPADTLVLIEMGGNDLIAGTLPADFDHQLDQFLRGCIGPGRTVVMFELPLLPHRVGFGQSQRRLAEKYGVILIPKRYFVQVLEAGTSDGLHLSPKGAAAMAELMGRVLRLTPPASPRSPA